MPKRSEDADRVPSTRGRFQYGLGALFLLTVVVSVACSFGAELARGRRVFEYLLMLAAAPLLLLIVVGFLVHLRDGRRP
jgi:hypothetical protein